MEAVLVYFRRGGERKDFPLKEGKTVVGRKEDCDYRIPLDQISREHCEFELGEDGLVLRDLGSSNGTFVNNKRVASARLKPGDEVVVGPVGFVVQIDGAPADPKPIKRRPAQRQGRPSDEDIADHLLDMGDEDDDETHKADLIDEEGEVELSDRDVDQSGGGRGDSDSLGHALEALAGGGEDDADPFADVEDEDEK